MDYDTIKNQLITHEGLRLKPYKCPAGKWTIGVGRNLDDVGITEREAMILLGNDIKDCIKDLQEIFEQFNVFPPDIQHVLIDMRFQLGMRGFLGFARMIAAVSHRDWAEMIVQMKNSAWYKQTTNRAENLIHMVKGCI